MVAAVVEGRAAAAAAAAMAHGSRLSHAQIPFRSIAIYIYTRCTRLPRSPYTRFHFVFIIYYIFIILRYTPLLLLRYERVRFVRFGHEIESIIWLFFFFYTLIHV